MRGRLKMAEGSVQALDELPADLRAIYRTAWELPMRALIDMAADRGAFIDQSQSLNLFVENPNIGQLSSMYFYAWKHGLKTTYYLRSRPATRIAKATVETAAAAPAPTGPARDTADVVVLARESRELRGLPVSHVTRPSRLLDPGLCLTLRPMAYPSFFEMYRGAIKNTWTVEEVDFATDVGDLSAKMTDAERHLVQRLVAFFATGDSIVANNLVLNLYRHLNAPEARMYLSRQLYEEALHVQFYLTLLDTYVPDPEARQEAFAAVENIPSIRRKAEFCMRWLDSIQACTRLRHRRPAPPVPAQPHLLRGLHRGAVLLRRLRLRVLPALARPAARAGGGHELGVPRRERAHGLCLRGGAHHPARGARAVRRGAWPRPCATCSTRRWPARRSSPRTCWAAAWPASRSRWCASIWSSAPISGWPRSACRASTAPRIRCRSWICRTCRR